ncbi:GLI pathogenesis-related 2, like isoform X2 [Synchiropus splendidus]|uniref:GLI pathogenesis-related 2, like isoform X2 n=1 Tax=Synchiropus splendidus TaxID=270530 RepID=UPI00237E0F7F|nr:GLI pathogenesis-related 2, like isoform X2 [Synchiropus splendidus]
MGKSASKQFAEELLECHNEYRRKHQAPPLKLDSKLSREASRPLHSHGVEEHGKDGRGQSDGVGRLDVRGGSLLSGRERHQPGSLREQRPSRCVSAEATV